MGISCQINTLTPPNAGFQPGETVSGVIKYAIHEPMEFERIITSLKGNGHLRLSVQSGHRYREYIFTANETYVDIDNVVTDHKIEMPEGCHEIKFNFKIPEKVPPTLNYKNYFLRYTVKCKIRYYIRIKFERPGWFTFSKHFKKEINVTSLITPQLLMVPIIYGEEKKLMRLFSRKNAVISIKAMIINSVIPIGGTIKLKCDINNNTNVLIKNVLSKLVEVYNFQASGHSQVKYYEDVPSTKSQTGCVRCGAIETRFIEINVPIDKVSLQNSKFVTREYVIKITVDLPIPHRNIVLNIPVQIGNIAKLDTSLIGENSAKPSAAIMSSKNLVDCDHLPPSYWEAMGEVNGDFEKGESSST